MAYHGFESMDEYLKAMVSSLDDGLESVDEITKMMVSLEAPGDSTLNIEKHDYYNGFNAKALCNIVQKRNNAAKLTRHRSYDIIRTTVAIALLRGNIRRDQIRKYTSVAGQVKIELVIKHWDMFTRKSAKDYTKPTPTTLTFARFIALFPQVASQYLVTNREKLVGRLPGGDANTFPAQTRRLPAAMLHSGFAGLIPNNMAQETFVSVLKNAHLAFMVEFYKVVNPTGNKTFADSFVYQKKHMADVMAGPMPDDVRIKCLLAFGINSLESVQALIAVVNDVFKLLNQTTVITIADFQVVGGKVIITEKPETQTNLELDAFELAKKFKIPSTSSASTSGSGNEV